MRVPSSLTESATSYGLVLGYHGGLVAEASYLLSFCHLDLQVDLLLILAPGCLLRIDLGDDPQRIAGGDLAPHLLVVDVCDVRLRLSTLDRYRRLELEGAVEVLVDLDDAQRWRTAHRVHASGAADFLRLQKPEGRFATLLHSSQCARRTPHERENPAAGEETPQRQSGECRSHHPRNAAALRSELRASGVEESQLHRK